MVKNHDFEKLLKMWLNIDHKTSGKKMLKGPKNIKNYNFEKRNNPFFP